MRKETTPMQELIESVVNMAQGLNEDELYDYVIRKATELLEKEKQMVVDAYEKGSQEADDWHSNPSGGSKTAEQYYNDKFNQA